MHMPNFFNICELQGIENGALLQTASQKSTDKWLVDEVLLR